MIALPKYGNLSEIRLSILPQYLKCYEHFLERLFTPEKAVGYIGLLRAHESDGWCARPMGREIWKRQGVC